MIEIGSIQVEERERQGPFQTGGQGDTVEPVQFAQVICFVCQQRVAKTVLEPCGHKAICDNDACKMGVRDWKTCPICEVTIEKILNETDRSVLVDVQSAPKYVDPRTRNRTLIARASIAIVLWLVAPFVVTAFLDGKAKSSWYAAVDLDGLAWELLWKGTVTVLLFVAFPLTLAAFALFCCSTSSKSSHESVDGKTAFITIAVGFFAPAAICAYLFGNDFGAYFAVFGFWLLFYLPTFCCVKNCYSRGVLNEKSPARVLGQNFVVTTIIHVIVAAITSQMVIPSGYTAPAAYHAACLIAGALSSVFYLPLMPVVFADILMATTNTTNVTSIL